MTTSDVLLKKLNQHSKLEGADITAIRKLSCQLRELQSEEDFIHQGDKPRASALLMEGLMGRYHTLGNGSRQYLSIHFPGDWPDAQGLFIDRMDHSVCALGRASVCAIPHDQLIETFRERPSVAFAVWRETLIDAAIFREAITNIGSRTSVARMAHFFCEVFYRARAVGLIQKESCPLPLSQTQIGEFLGLSLVSVNRSLRFLRGQEVADLASGKLTISDFEKLANIGGFDDTYLHLKVQVLR
jgi:CRP-like cAMP-binding protein